MLPHHGSAEAMVDKQVRTLTTGLRRAGSEAYPPVEKGHKKTPCCWMERGVLFPWRQPICDYFKYRCCVE